MTTQQLLEKWQSLDSEEQQQVLAFIDAIYQTKKPTKPSSPLGEKLRKIRQEIIESGWYEERALEIQSVNPRRNRTRKSRTSWRLCGLIMIRTFVDAGVLIYAARAEHEMAELALQILEDDQREFA